MHRHDAYYRYYLRMPFTIETIKSWNHVDMLGVGATIHYGIGEVFHVTKADK